jgi:hypothetical protein
MEIPRHWRLKDQRYRLVGGLCLKCGQASFPARPVCPQCSLLPEREAVCARLVLPVSEQRAEPLTPERISG